MATHEHFILKRLEGQLERRKRPGFGSPVPREALSHGSRISSEIIETLHAYESLAPIDDIDPSLILKVTIAGNVSEDDWNRMDLSILSIDENNTTVLFSSDHTLQKFLQRVNAYKSGPPPGQTEPPYAQLVSSIDSVSMLQAIDRIGPVLKANGLDEPAAFRDDTSYILDYELFHTSDQTEAMLFAHRLERAIAPFDGGIVSRYYGTTMIIVRARCNGDGVRAALDLPELALVDPPPQPDLLSEEFGEVTLGDLPPGAAPPDEAITIGIVDSGVNFGHALLAPLNAGAFSLATGFGPDDAAGHGTAVASIAAFGDIEARIAAQDFDGEFKIASARVTDDNGKFSSEITVPTLMANAVRTLHETYKCRIINISMGDINHPFLGGRVDTWTATLDEIAKELDVLIIVSAGNRTKLLATYGEAILQEYPQLLLSDESRIIAPAPGVNLLAVGAIANSNGIESSDEESAGVRPVCNKEEPSPFTRSGPGVRKMIKPDFVDFGGNAVWDGPLQTLVSGNQKRAAGILSCHHKPLDRMFSSRAGTSFAAPNITYKAALLLSRMPDASANLLRALLGLSARIPQAPRTRANRLTEKDLLLVTGHGVPDPLQASQSEDDRVVFYTEDSIKIDHFAVYEVPIPSVFQKTRGEREIRVSLAFDPPTRHTRADYTGTRMGWRLVRGSSENDVFDRFRKWEKKTEGKPPEFSDNLVCKSDIGPAIRDSGTLQVGTYTAKTDISNYGDKYYLAVWCTRRWAPADIEMQKFAVCVQLRHRGVNNLYQMLSMRLKT